MTAFYNFFFLSPLNMECHFIQKTNFSPAWFVGAACKSLLLGKVKSLQQTGLKTWCPLAVNGYQKILNEEGEGLPQVVRLVVEPRYVAMMAQVQRVPTQLM